MVGIKSPDGVLMPKVKTVMTHLNTRAKDNCHMERSNNGPAEPKSIEIFEQGITPLLFFKQSEFQKSIKSTGFLTYWRVAWRYRLRHRVDWPWN